MKTVAFHTLGCKLNFAETSTIGRQFASRGFGIVDFSQPSDVYVLNTCSVTDRADKECRQIIRRVLRQSPHAYVIVMGCYAQLRPEELSRIEGVDLILGSKDKFHLFDRERHFIKESIPEIYVSCIDEATEMDPAFSAEVGGRTRAFLKIQDGCDYSCSFCTIPVARGKSRSMPIPAVVEQASFLAGQGYKEIVLTGVNVGDYGKKISASLFELMKALEDVEGIERIRISSIEPNLLSWEMIEYIFQSEKFCPHFHIPLQSGSDAILKKMQRRYQRQMYADLVSFIKMKNPDAAVGVDVITGFPGESDRHFRETFQFLSELPVSYLHVFTYSERPDTAAVTLSSPVERRIRFERSETLRMLGQRKRCDFASSFIGKTLPVLYEVESEKGRRSGLTPNYIRVEAESPSARPNEIVPTKIVCMEGDICIGTV
jgi:threonylcarbamoyladenosine tRNA methylthiotransferase MtaB